MPPCPGRAAVLPPPPLLFFLLLLLPAPRPVAAGCAALGLCCPGRAPSCRSTGWRPDGSYGQCYCDQACEHTLDCCHDYSQACPVIPCIVSQWSAWSGCAEPCKTTYRVRRRHIIQEPRNGGEACPALEERAGCMEYWTEQGTECKQSLIPALITTGGFGKARKKRAAADGHERVGYCVEFQLVAITQGCLHSHHSYTHWMQYLREGHTVCVECQHPALDSESLHCYGDGSGSQRLRGGKNCPLWSLGRNRTDSWWGQPLSGMREVSVKRFLPSIRESAVALAGGGEPTMQWNVEENSPAGHLLLSFCSQLLVHLTPDSPSKQAL